MNVVGGTKGSQEVSSSYPSSHRNSAPIMWDIYWKKNGVRIELSNGLKVEAYVPPQLVVAFKVMRLTSTGYAVKAASTDFLSFYYRGTLVTFYGYLRGDIIGAFREYSWLDVKGKRVLDVGACIGDTAVYFGLRGAKEVVAFEPYPFMYDFAVKNVKANSLGNVKVINGGVGGKDGVVRLTTEETRAVNALKPSAEGAEVPVYSLDHVLEEFGPFDVIKMDCEGCEYDALASSKKIGDVGQIQVEYHYGPERVLEALKRSGFKVRASAPRETYRPQSSNPHTLVGYAYGWRKQASC